MFYGWYIVLAGLFIRAFNEWVVFYGFTAFINPIANTFGWSYAQISLAVSVRGMESGIVNPLVGVVSDRWSHKKLVLSGVVIVGLGLLCLSQITNLAIFYISFFIIGLGISLCMTMVPMTTIVRWFRRDVGKAVGIIALGSGIGGSFLPVLVKVIDAYGWQNSLVILAVGTWVLGIPLALVFRSRPEDYGLLPDGKRQENSGDSRGSESYDSGIGVKEALKMRVFWQLGLAFMFQVSGLMAVLTHVMPYLVSYGVERTAASMVAMLIPLISLAGRVAFGWLADTFTKKYVSAVSMALSSIGLFLFWLIDGSSLWLMVLFAVAFGLGLGGLMPLRVSIFREYFGTKRFGTILGLVSTFGTVGTVVAPPVAGWVFDTLGVYDPAWITLSGITMVGVILMLTVPPASENLGKVTS